MVAFTRALYLGAALVLLTGNTWAADEGLSRVEIARIGKPATALVEVKLADGFGYGSAFCIHPSGLFLTNDHVTASAQGDITLVLDSGLQTQKIYQARVVRADPQRDLALLRVEGVKDLPALTLGSDEKLGELMEVVACGFPFGKMLAPSRQHYPAISINPGSITALRNNKDGILSAIQLDVALNEGNSGGPILDKTGKVVGVVVAGLVDRGGGRTGVNFAIPVNSVARFLARPEVQFKPPALAANNMYKPVRFEAQVVPILPSRTPFMVDLLLKSASGREQTHHMEAAGDTYHVTTAPLPPPSEPVNVRLLVRLDDGLLSATVTDRAFKVGDRELKLSDTRSLQHKPRPRVLLQDGKTLDGTVTGLDAVPVRQGDRTLTVNLARAAEVNFSPALESNLLGYTLLVRQEGKEVFRLSHNLSIQGLLPAPLGAGSAATEPPLLEGDRVVRKLPAEITDVAVGGAGRYLILHLRSLHQLAIFDASTATVMGSISMNEDEGLFAAGLDSVIVVLPRSGTIERWNLKTLERESTTELPIKGVIKAIAMGSASKGPLLIHWAVGKKELDRACFSLLSVEPMRLSANDIKIHPIFGCCYRDLVHLRASANGTVFGLWCTSHLPSGVGTIVLGDAGPRSSYEHNSFGHILPSPDGKVIFTGIGEFTPEARRQDIPQRGDARLPACNTNYYLALSNAGQPGQVTTRQPPTLRLRGRDTPIATFTDLDLTVPREDFIKNDFTYDKRVHLIPEARLIITIPGPSDQLVLHRLDAALFEARVGEMYHFNWQDERTFVAGGDAGPRGEIRLWDVATGTLLHQFVPGGQPWYNGGLFLPDGKQFLSWCSSESNLFLWDVGTGKLVRKLPGPCANPFSVAISPDGKRYLAGGNDKIIYLYDLETGKELVKLQGHEDKCSGLFSPDGKQVLTYGPDKTLCLWDPDSGKLLHKLAGHTAACSGVFSPDSKQVLSCSSDKTVRLWNATTGEAVRTFEGPAAEVTCASFLPGGDRIVAWGKDRTVRIWEAQSGKMLNQFDLGGKLGEAPNVALSPDGRRLLTSNDNKTVHILDLTTGKLSEAQRFANAIAVQGFSISPDGCYAVAGTFRAGVYLWRLPR
jgi:WD40 repeat protein